MLSPIHLHFQVSLHPQAVSTLSSAIIIFASSSLSLFPAEQFTPRCSLMSLPSPETEQATQLLIHHLHFQTLIPEQSKLWHVARWLPRPYFAKSPQQHATTTLCRPMLTKFDGRHNTIQTNTYNEPHTCMTTQGLHNAIRTEEQQGHEPTIAFKPCAGRRCTYLSIHH